MLKRLLMLLVLIFIISFGFRLVIYDEDFYLNEFQKNGVYDKLDKNEVEENLVILFNYFKKNKNLDTDFFNEKEKLHLKDVKSLIQKTINMFYLSLLFIIALIFYIKDKKDVAKNILYGSILTIVVIIILFIVSYTNFTSLFYNFHLTFFSNDYWLLNPETDNLIIMFPQGFFIDSLQRIFLFSLLISAIIALITVLRLYKREIKKVFLSN